jgi:hypothetical protein
LALILGKEGADDDVVHPTIFILFWNLCLAPLPMAAMRNTAATPNNNARAVRIERNTYWAMTPPKQWFRL